MNQWGESTVSRRSDLMFWLLPVAVGFVGAIGGFIYSNAQDDRFEHRVVLVSNHDGRVGVRDNRDLAVEAAEVELAKGLPTDVSVRLVTRFNSVLDIYVQADTAATAQSEADRIGTAVVTARTSAAQARFVDRIAADRASIAELEALDDPPLGEIERLEGFIRNNENSILSENKPLAVSRSVSEGQVAPERRKTTGLAGAAAAMVALILMTLVRRQPGT